MMTVKMLPAFLCLMFGLAKSTSMVELSSVWKPNFGWEVVCSWQLYANDSLQSVRLYKTDQQFMIYRPERDGPKRSTLIRLPNMEFLANCDEIQKGGVTGKCVMTMEPFQPVRDDQSYSCEVSGERPTFRIESKSIRIEALVPPSDAVVEKINQNDENSARLTVNCTSSGLPAPTLVWTIGDQKIPQDFSGGSWNFTSKLYHVWSSLSYTPGISHAICTPETLRGGKTERGQPSFYNSAVNLKSTTTMLLSVLPIILSR